MIANHDREFALVKKDAIYTISPTGELERIPCEPYSNELLLQQLIADYPELLAGDLIDPDAPPRWFLVSSETGIPDNNESHDRWAMDHLLIDQWGRPTFVEVKRSTDTRIRREVVGQMLDYAANALAYWPSDRIRGLAVETAGSAEGLSRALFEFLGGEVEQGSYNDVIEAFWASVHRHLANGEVRLLFVADQIPTELRRIIEFLNEHMPAIEVLGIEIRQYQGESIKALVPRVVGQTEYARQSKPGNTPRSKLTREEFLARCSNVSRQVFEIILDESGSHRIFPSWGTTGFSLRVQRPCGTWTSFAYAVLPDQYKDDHAHLQVYLGNFTLAEDASLVRSRLLKAAPFTQSGQYTLDLPLDFFNSDHAAKFLPILWDIAATLERNPAREPEA